MSTHVQRKRMAALAEKPSSALNSTYKIWIVLGTSLSLGRLDK